MSNQEQRLPGGLRKELFAALQEMQFWLRIMQEHAGLIRNGLDPTEESLLLSPQFLTLEEVACTDPEKRFTEDG